MSVTKARFASKLAIALVAVASMTAGVTAAEPSAGATSSVWNIQSQYPSFVSDLQGISCPSASVCIAVGQNPNQFGSIITTTDGGSSWSGQTVPTGIEQRYGISCIPTTTCVAVGMTSTSTGAVLTTTSGGGTWTSSQESQV